MYFVKKVVVLFLLLAQIASVAQAGTVTYYHTDLLGSPVLESNSAGVIKKKVEYRPYGQNELDKSGSGPGFTGHVNDAGSGLTYMQSRYYDPQIGRFLSVDPVLPKVGDSFSFNRFAYANNNPYKYNDPSGEMPFLVAAYPAITALFAALTATYVVQKVFSSSQSASGLGSASNKNNDYVGGVSRGALIIGAVHIDAVQSESSNEQGEDSGGETDSDVIPEAPVGSTSVPSDKWWKDQGIDAHVEKSGMGDSKRNLAIDKKLNVWTVDRRGSGNPEYVGKLKDMKGGE